MWIALAEFQGGQRHERLEGGAGRIHALQGAVVEGMVGRAVQYLPALGVDAVDEHVGVVTRLADQSQHAARGRFDGHQRAAPLAEGAFRYLLQSRIQRQQQIVARHWQGAAQRAHGSPVGVGLDFVESRGAVQIRLVTPFQAHLADEVRALVIRGQLLVVQPVLIGLRKPADVTDHVRGHFSVGIMPEQACADVYAGEAELVGREPRHLHVVEPGADGEAGKIVGLLQQLVEALAVLGRNLDHGRQLIDQRLQVTHLRRRDLERIRSVVMRDHRTVAVQHQAAVGTDRNDGDAVVLGQRMVVLVLQNLQVEEPDQQEKEDDQHKAGTHHQSHLEVVQLLLMVAQFGPPTPSQYYRVALLARCHAAEHAQSRQHPGRTWVAGARVSR